MLILTIRTDKPDAEVGLFNNSIKADYFTWQAHRQLGETAHVVIRERLLRMNKDWHDIQGVVYFSGPGSFTGLRIGAAIANALRDSLRVPVVSVGNKDWIETGINLVQSGTDELAVPHYGAEARTTQQKH